MLVLDFSSKMHAGAVQHEQNGFLTGRTLSTISKCPRLRVLMASEQKDDIALVQRGTGNICRGIDLSALCTQRSKQPVHISPTYVKIIDAAAEPLQCCADKYYET